MGVVKRRSGSAWVDAVARERVGGQWVNAIPTVRANGAWQTTTPPPTSINRPANPAAIVYGSGLTNASAWAHPGALVIAGRDNYNGAWAHTVADGGGTVLVYLDALIDNVTGRYHQKLTLASEFGPAVPRWPGNPVASQWGNLNDFRVGGILQSKYTAVLNLILAENPHVSGFFLDDLGSRSWYPNFSWTSIDREAYRAGAIAMAQKARAVCDANDKFMMVNGTWGATSSTGVGDGGYPDRTKAGLSLADGGFIENHSASSEFAYWSAYANSAQWGSATPRQKSYNWFSNVNSVADRNTWVNANLAAFASATDYSSNAPAPWTTFTDFHIPSRSTAPPPPAPPPPPPPPAAPQPVGPTGTWTLAFEDTFDGSSLNLSKWSSTWFNGGSQNNVATSAANVAVSGGNLTLTRANATSGASINTNPDDRAGNSAKVGFKMGLGVAEARCWFPGDGSKVYNWAAWWVNGANWPYDGEHDVFEILGGNATVNYHSGSGAHNQGAIPGYWGGAWHTYTVHRKTGSADVYYDGVKVKSYPTDDNTAPQYLILNVGGGQGSPDAFGAASQIKVDYVRCWR